MSAASRINFYGREFYVDENVLTPRPETEQLIDEVLSLAGKPYLPGIKPTSRRLPEHPIILDVGTGSGCIAITLKLELPDSEVYALDISEPALKIAQENSVNLGAKVKFFKSDLLNCQLAGGASVSFEGPKTWPSGPERPEKEMLRQDPPTIIVANLPYVDKNWPWLDKESLKTDPDIALYADDHGLKLIKELIKTANSKYLVLEADPCEHQEIISFAKSHGYVLTNTRGFILSFVRA